MSKTSKKTPKTLEERCNILLHVWMLKEKGRGEYKFCGGYWEVLYPLLQKYAPEKLKEYERMLPDTFDYFDPRVKAALDAGDEESNFRNAVNYMNDRISSLYTTSSVHQIELGDDEILAYVPNQNIDQNQYWGREDNSDLF